MNNRINKICNLYKISNMDIKNPYRKELDLNKENQFWNQISPLYSNIRKLKIKWFQFYEQSGEVDSSKISKNFEGFSNWIDENLPEEMSFIDGIKFLIKKITDFNPNKQLTNKIGLPMDKFSIDVPEHMKTVAQPKEDQQIFDYNKWKEEIAKVESRGDYRARNKHTNALGKYQFVPKIWWNKIQSFANGKAKIDSYEDFLDNPQLQEDFMKFYTENNLLPFLRKFRAKEKNDLPEASLLSDGKLMALFHFQGPTGAENWLKSGRMVGALINISVASYLNKIS